MPEWHRCPDPECDVRWFDNTTTCWNCGKTAIPTRTAAPRITSQTQMVPAMSDREWGYLRRELGAA